MQKVILVLLTMIVSTGFTQVNKQIKMMSPEERENLSISMLEVADSYKTNNNLTKANSFYKGSLAVYPIGDKAHQLAKFLKITLDDQQTFSNFIEMGDTAYQNKNYKLAVASYLMANELFSPTSLYTQLSMSYKALGDTKNADYYHKLATNLETKDEKMIESQEGNKILSEEDMLEAEIENEIMEALEIEIMQEEINEILYEDYQEQIN